METPCHPVPQVPWALPCKGRGWGPSQGLALPLTCHQGVTISAKSKPPSDTEAGRPAEGRPVLSCAGMAECGRSGVSALLAWPASESTSLQRQGTAPAPFDWRNFSPGPERPLPAGTPPRIPHCGPGVLALVQVISLGRSFGPTWGHFPPCRQVRDTCLQGGTRTKPRAPRGGACCLRGPPAAWGSCPSPSFRYPPSSASGLKLEQAWFWLPKSLQDGRPLSNAPQDFQFQKFTQLPSKVYVSVPPFHHGGGQGTCPGP